MAKNDIISAISESNTDLIYQPAAGVEVVTTAFGTTLIASNINLTDGVISSVLCKGSTTLIIKFALGLTNARYLKMDAAGTSNYTSFTGVQTK